jgi:hypothetical protein
VIELAQEMWRSEVKRRLMQQVFQVTMHWEKFKEALTML